MLEFIFASGERKGKGKGRGKGTGKEKEERGGGARGSAAAPGDGFREHSPTQVARRFGSAAGAPPLPLPFPVALFHGTSDVTCPAEQSEGFHAALLSALEGGGRGGGKGAATSAT